MRVNKLGYGEQGTALLIVLTFVVLLTALAMGYLSRTATDRTVAHSSFNRSKADELAQSATDVIIGDFRQEIVNNSTATSTPAGSNNIYTPNASGSMLPVRNPTGNPDPIPNLIRRSWSGDTNLNP